MEWVLVANGECAVTASIRALLRGAGHIVGVDGGCRHVHAAGLIPDVVIGDMDSLSEPLRRTYQAQGVQLIQHAVHKDFTDLELALELAITGGASQITILGGTGGRFDHGMANVLNLSRCLDHGVAARICDARQSIVLIDTALDVQGAVGDILSVLPLTAQVQDVWLYGLRYPLRGETLFFGSSRGVSNVFVEPRVRIVVGQGRLLVVHQYASALSP